MGHRHQQEKEGMSGQCDPVAVPHLARAAECQQEPPCKSVKKHQDPQSQYDNQWAPLSHASVRDDVTVQSSAPTKLGR